VLDIVWLGHEANRSGLHGSCASAILRMTGDENDGDAVAPGDQPVLQVDATQSRHSQIADEARYVVDLIGFEKFVGRGKRGSAVAQRAHERFRPVADGFIVIDDRNYWNIRHKSDTRARGRT